VDNPELYQYNLTIYLVFSNCLSLSSSLPLVVPSIDSFNNTHTTRNLSMTYPQHTNRWFACQYSPIVLKQSPTLKSGVGDKFLSARPQRSLSSFFDACNSMVRSFLHTTLSFVFVVCVSFSVFPPFLLLLETIELFMYCIVIYSQVRGVG
jgi:hypothetical protein